MGIAGEVAKRGGGDAWTSAMTRDKEIAGNPHLPEGLGRDGPIPLLLLLADVHDIASSSRLDLGSVALPTNVIVFITVST